MISDKYENVNGKLQYKCLDCGETIDSCWNIIRAPVKGCRYCANRTVVLNDKNNILALYPDLIKEKWDFEKNIGIDPKNFNKGSQQKVWWKCEKCNNSHFQTIHGKIKKSNSCPDTYKYRSKSLDEFWNIFNETMADDYEILNDVKSYKSDFIIRHNNCGHQFKTNGTRFLTLNQTCPKCCGSFKGSTQQLKERLYNKYKDEYQLIGEYEDSHTKVNIKHNCGCKFFIYPNDLLHNKYPCPECRIKNIFTGENNVNWNGGYKDIYNYLRSAALPWKYESSEHYNRRCLITNKTSNIVIHHINKNFNDIVDDLFKISKIEKRRLIKDYTVEELYTLGKLCLEIHRKEGYGIPIQSRVHIDFHKEYGFTKNNKDQFIDFAFSKGVDLTNIIS